MNVSTPFLFSFFSFICLFAEAWYHKELIYNFYRVNNFSNSEKTLITSFYNGFPSELLLIFEREIYYLTNYTWNKNEGFVHWFVASLVVYSGGDKDVRIMLHQPSASGLAPVLFENSLDPATNSFLWHWLRFLFSWSFWHEQRCRECSEHAVSFPSFHLSLFMFISFIPRITIPNNNFHYFSCFSLFCLTPTQTKSSLCHNWIHKIEHEKREMDKNIFINQKFCNNKTRAKETHTKTQWKWKIQLNEIIYFFQHFLVLCTVKPFRVVSHSVPFPAIFSNNSNHLADLWVPI